MKILHIGKYFSPFSGGLENYMRDAMVALAKRDFASIALVHRHSLSLKTVDETFTASGHKFHVVRTGMWARLLYTPISPAFPMHLRRLVKLYKPDILHLHLPNPSVFWVLALPSARQIPWVVHWHSDVITSAQDWKMKFFYKLYQPFERAVLGRAKAIVATSLPYRDSSEPLKKWLSKCQVVPLGVDTERFSKANREVNALWEARPRGDHPTPAPNKVNHSTVGGASRGDHPTPTPNKDNHPTVGGASRGDSQNKSQHQAQEIAAGTRLPHRTSHSQTGTQTHRPLQVLAVGRLTYYKGFRYLIEAAALTKDIHINLVGKGDQAGDLRALVSSLKLQDRVTFHGSLSNDELAGKMASCDCLCLPSVERTEAFGMVLLEAMYFGKATVVSDVRGSGMGWITEDGVTGIKVKPADADSLAAALKRLSDNREELAAMGQRGKEKFDQQFEINHAVDGLVKVYQQTWQSESK